MRSRLVDKRKHGKLKMEKKLQIVLEVISEVLGTSLDTDDFIEKKLEQICSRELPALEEVICFF